MRSKTTEVVEVNTRSRIFFDDVTAAAVFSAQRDDDMLKGRRRKYRKVAL